MLLRFFEWNIQIRGRQMKWDSIKALQSIFRLSTLMWLPIRCRTFSFLLTILQILLIRSSILVLSPKLPQVIFHLDCKLKQISPLCIWAKDNMTFFRISFHMIISTSVKIFFSNSLKLRSYRYLVHRNEE